MSAPTRGTPNRLNCSTAEGVGGTSPKGQSESIRWSVVALKKTDLSHTDLSEKLDQTEWQLKDHMLSNNTASWPLRIFSPGMEYRSCSQSLLTSPVHTPEKRPMLEKEERDRTKGLFPRTFIRALRTEANPRVKAVDSTNNKSTKINLVHMFCGVTLGSKLKRFSLTAVE